MTEDDTNNIKVLAIQ